ncbi:histone-lysine N-methyltransferase family member SUVH9-like [Rutidosis leptorrhynchoides]|uniref:histone-lysine N-methyltransferase family member SUVH9-like n=1 Tax=Rutidosis leptorrhynchoides TaxID=125765 RepID=UPI003A99347B
MASVIDLNLFPDSPVTDTPTATSPFTLTTPKLEPKEEPFDEPPQFTRTNFINPNPNFTLNTQQPPNTSQLQLLLQQQLAAQHTSNTNEQDVYSEFKRVSEMFRSAFRNSNNFNSNEFIDPNSLAIVPVPEENQHSVVTESASRRNQARSSELVRVSLGIDEERHFRDTCRKTRLMYDSLRVLCALEDEKRRSTVTIGRRAHSRSDLRAASVMKSRGLWQHRDKRIVGSIPGVYIGDIFFFRMELCVVGLHGLPQAGIDYLTSSQSSNGDPIATSIIVSGGYEDDQDAGDVIIYTGQGGQDKFCRQANHQRLEGGNLGMERSMHHGIEVRVVRGFKYEGSPSGKVYVYDGLYKVVGSWLEAGKSGFAVIKFKLVRIENQPEMGSSILKYAETLRNGPLDINSKGCVRMDMSMNKENVPVYLFNDIDDNHEPMYYEYLAKSVFPPFVYHLGAKGGGCNCVDGCMDGCLCARKNGGEFAYDRSGLLLRGKPLIFECGPHCKCPPSCRNRVSQNGIKHRFEVFRSRETGWGVRSFDLIQAGTFICEYSGVVLTREQAQLFSMNGDSLIYPNRFCERWAEWGDLSQIFSDYVRPSYPSVPPLDFAMDVSRMRNVACYVSHSSCPNVLVQLVLYDHSNFAFPHLMLFALENIPPMRELSLDYGEADEWAEKLSICN